jgi:hypothetical protein
MSENNYRRVDGPTATQEEWDRIESILVARNWNSLNRDASRILVAEDVSGQLLGFFVAQYVIHTEPMWVLPSQRASGIADDLADKMLEFMISNNARGWVLVANSPIVAKMAEARGMVREESPVYVTK